MTRNVAELLLDAQVYNIIYSIGILGAVISIVISLADIIPFAMWFGRVYMLLNLPFSSNTVLLTGFISIVLIMWGGVRREQFIKDFSIELSPETGNEPGEQDNKYRFVNKKDGEVELTSE